MNTTPDGRSTSLKVYVKLMQSKLLDLNSPMPSGTTGPHCAAQRVLRERWCDLGVKNGIVLIMTATEEVSCRLQPEFIGAGPFVAFV